MRAVKLFHENGKLLSKQEVLQLYHQQYYKDVPEEQLWLITDADGYGSHGCLNLATGDWEYFKETEFEEVK